MAYNTPETVADYLARFQMEITHRGKGTFTPDHVKYSLTIASSGRPSFLSAISTRKRFPLTAKRTIWKTAGMGLMVTPRKRMPRKRTIEMHSRL